MGWLRNKVYAAAARVLTKPRRSYHLVLPNNLGNLRQQIQKGDVVLVDGEQRVSEVIKYLTQSSWSHVGLYVGDELLRRSPDRGDDLYALYGKDAEHLIVEALLETGVTTSPLRKYADFNLRVCRPRGLRRDDLQRILDEVIGQIGSQYDVKSLLELGRYFFPVSLIPRRFRRRALSFGGGVTSHVLCSSMVARAFQNVGFPILPAIEPMAHAPARPRLLDRLRRIRAPYPAVFHRQAEQLITPRDFDLSPYFEVVKFNAIEQSGFDYRRIRWA
jgi:hypothetical protein